MIGSNPIGALTGQRYPDSLIHPESTPLSRASASPGGRCPASSLVIRGGYGVYYDTSVYQTLATQMAQQFPLSKSLSVQNTAANPLTLANGFNACRCHHHQYLRRRSQLPPRLRAELAVVRAARPAWFAADDGHLSRHQGNPWNTGVPAEYLSHRSNQSLSRLPVRLRICRLERKFHSLSPVNWSCGGGCTVDSRQPSCTRSQKRLTRCGVGRRGSFREYTERGLGGLRGGIQCTESGGRAELAGSERGTRPLHV